MKQKDIIPNFYVLEGLDGSGTTTQAGLLSAKFVTTGRPHFATFEPTRGTIGRLIRRYLRGEEQAEPETLALLFAADRHEHIFGADGILQHSARREAVISDRYLFSSLAYQSGECGFSYVLSLNEKFPLPEILFYLDLSPEVCVTRMADRDNLEIYENLRKQKEVYILYEEAMSCFGDKQMRIIRIDGSLSRDEIAEKIWSEIPVEADNKGI